MDPEQARQPNDPGRQADVDERDGGAEEEGSVEMRGVDEFGDGRLQALDECRMSSHRGGEE